MHELLVTESVVETIEKAGDLVCPALFAVAERCRCPRSRRPGGVGLCAWCSWPRVQIGALA
jgi:hypothetical protein